MYVMYSICVKYFQCIYFMHLFSCTYFNAIENIEYFSHFSIHQLEYKTKMHFEPDCSAHVVIELPKLEKKTFRHAFKISY